jgi:hypothetical protein
MVDEMLRKGVEPLTWMRARNAELGLYPDSTDPDFASRLYRKTEFASLASTSVTGDVCAKSRQAFEQTAVQRLVARFMHPSTPYRGMLLNHGVGVGKTCSAITVAESFLEVMPANTVYILAPSAIGEGFRRTIFEVERLRPTTKDEFALTGERWTSPQCTGMTYLRLSGTAASESKEEIEKEVTALVRTRYKIMGYLAFARWVKTKIDAIQSRVGGAEGERMANDMLMSMFSDHLIIVDEAHNLRDAAADVGGSDEPDASAATDAAEGKALTPILRRILSVCEGTRLMLMTATPMYNTAPEILFLLNLLILNDTKDASKELVHAAVFKGDGTLTSAGEAQLVKAIRRYVSYMRGENPNTFPLRLTPPEKAGAPFLARYPTTSISRREGATRLSPTDKAIMERLPLIIHDMDESTIVGRELLRALEEHTKPREEREGPSEVSDFVLDQTLQLGNMVYPDGKFGGNGWRTYFEEVIESHAGARLAKYRWRGVDDMAIDDVFTGAGLKQHAPKIAAIVESITAAKGMSFVFSRFVAAGALPIAIALELAGWCRVLADGTPAPLLIREGAPKPKHYYVLLTSNKEISPNFDGLLEYATKFETPEMAITGSKVKAILGSQVVGEGLDLKCIRELHLLDGWYHLNRIEQIEGRGVRFCSHVSLPMEERNCLIYLHTINVPKYETADLYAYRLAVRKAQPIGRITRLMKINAWDCMLNREAILLKGLGTRRVIDAHGRIIEAYELEDQPFSNFCDFSDKCEYACGSAEVPAANVGKNMSTYTEFDYRRKFLEKEEILARLFADEVAEPLEGIRDKVFYDIPWSVGAIGLREMLGRIRIKRTDGIYGTIVYQNGYIVFQPADVTDTHIPLALRYGRAYAPLARTMAQSRGAILAAAAPLAAPEEEPELLTATSATTTATTTTAAAPPHELYARAIRSLDEWLVAVDAMMRIPSGPIDMPAGFVHEKFSAIRWTVHRFRDLPTTPLILARWWMDNLWSYAERVAVLSEWTKGATGREAAWADLYRPTELFTGAALSGFVVYDNATETTGLRTYCITRDSPEPQLCSSALEEIALDALGAPVSLEKDTNSVFGLMVTNERVPVFKTVHKPSAKGNLQGAQCSNDSVLNHHYPRIISADQELRAKKGDDPIIPLLLGAADVVEKGEANDRKERQKAVKDRYLGKKAKDLDLVHINDMNRQQICFYLEFVLRYMEIQRVDGKRWFIPLAEAARARPKLKFT